MQNASSRRMQEPEYDVPYRRDPSELPLEAQNISPYMTLGRTRRRGEEPAYTRADNVLERDDSMGYMAVGADADDSHDDAGREERVYDAARSSGSGAAAPRQGSVLYEEARASAQGGGQPLYDQPAPALSAANSQGDMSAATYDEAAPASRRGVYDL
jgi:hypothetical protein